MKTLVTLAICEHVEVSSTFSIRDDLLPTEMAANLHCVTHVQSCTLYVAVYKFELSVCLSEY